MLDHEKQTGMGENIMHIGCLILSRIRFYPCLLGLLLFLGCAPVKNAALQSESPSLTVPDLVDRTNTISTPEPTIPALTLTRSPSQTSTPTHIQTPSSTHAPLPVWFNTLRVIFNRVNDAAYAFDLWLWQNGSEMLLKQGLTFGNNFQLSSDGNLLAYKIVPFARVIDIDNLEERTIGEETGTTIGNVEEYEWIPGTHDLIFNTYHYINPDGVMEARGLYWAQYDPLKWKAILGKDKAELQFHLSPDGKRVLVYGVHGVGVVDIDGRNYRNFNMNGSISYEIGFAWEGSSQTLFVATHDKGLNFEDGKTVVWKIPMSGSPPTVLTEFPYPYEIYFSPDATKYIVDGGDDGTFITNMDGSNKIYISRDNSYSLKGWAPDSRHFLLLGPEGNYFIAAIGEEPIPIAMEIDGDFRWVDGEYYFICDSKGQLFLGSIYNSQDTDLIAKIDPQCEYDFAY